MARYKSPRKERGEIIFYSDLIKQLEQLGHGGIDRFVIGGIVGGKYQSISINDPSIYPSAIVVRKDTMQPGKGFWGIDTGTDPPNKVPINQRQSKLKNYQQASWQVQKWSCDCKMTHLVNSI